MLYKEKLKGNLKKAKFQYDSKSSFAKMRSHLRNDMRTLFQIVFICFVFIYKISSHFLNGYLFSL